LKLQYVEVILCDVTEEYVVRSGKRIDNWWRVEFARSITEDAWIISARHWTDNGLKITQE